MSSDEHTSVDSGVDDFLIEDVTEVEVSQANDAPPFVINSGLEEYQQLCMLMEENERLSMRLRDLQMENERLTTDILIWKIYSQELEAEIDRLTKILQSFWLLKKIDAAWKHADVLGTFWFHESNVQDKSSTDDCVPNTQDLFNEIPTYANGDQLELDDSYVHIEIPADDNEYIVLSLSDLEDM